MMMRSTGCAILTVSLIMSSQTLLPTNLKADPDPAKIRELEAEFSKEEKKRQVKELIMLGDELIEVKDYQRALEAYEHVFTLDPENVRASAKIDLLKKQVGKEGKSEAGIVGAVYEEEIQNRIHQYMTETKEYLQAEKIGQARLSLQKILLLDPFHKEAQQLLTQLEGDRNGNVNEERKTL